MTIPQDMLDVYFAPDSDASPNRAAKHDAAAILRDLSADLLYVDTEVADVSEVVAALAEVRVRLRALPRRETTPARTRNGDGRLVERSPLSGQGNPVSPPMTLRFDGERAIASATFDARYEGPPDHVHGGVIAGAIDEMLGVGQLGSGQVGPTGELTIRLHRPTPLYREIDFVAWTETQDGRKVTVRAEVRLDGDLLAEASGLFISAR